MGIGAPRGADGRSLPTAVTLKNGLSASGVHLRNIPWLAGGVAVVVTFGCLPAADAFVCTRTGLGAGPSVAWTVRTVSWVAHPNIFRVYEGANEDVQASFAAWAATQCSDLDLAFDSEREVQAGFREGAMNTNVVVLLRNAWPYQSGAIAVTTTTFNTQTGALIDADIEMNGEHFTFVRADATCDQDTKVMDLRNTLTHEVGHLIGLEHPPSTPAYSEATMFASAPSCEIKKRTLAQDDIDGVCFIYPSGQPTQACFEVGSPSFEVADADEGFGCRAATGDSRGTLWAILLGVGWTCRRARYGRKRARL